MYSPREIARAAGVPEARVRAALGDNADFVSHRTAVAIGRRLVAERPGASGIFSIFGAGTGRRSRLPFAVSSTLHAGVCAALVFVFTFGPEPIATTLTTVDPPAEPMRLVLLDTPGPGGGGGGGGLLQKAPPPKALREGLKKSAARSPNANHQKSLSLSRSRRNQNQRRCPQRRSLWSLPQS